MNAPSLPALTTTVFSQCRSGPVWNGSPQTDSVGSVPQSLRQLLLLPGHLSPTETALLLLRHTATLTQGAADQVGTLARCHDNDASGNSRGAVASKRRAGCFANDLRTRARGTQNEPRSCRHVPCRRKQMHGLCAYAGSEYTHDLTPENRETPFDKVRHAG